MTNSRHLQVDGGTVAHGRINVQPPREMNMRRKDYRAALSVMAFGVASWMLMGCGSSAVRPAALPEKPVAKQDDHKLDAPKSIELDTSPFQGDDRAKLVRAVQFHEAKKYADAARLLEELRERHPQHIVILHELALTYRTMGENDKAIDVLMPYSGGLPPETLSSLGSALDDAGRPKEAFHVLRWGITKYPDSGLLYSDLGVVLLRTGDAAHAMQSFHEGMRAEPSWPSNYLNSAKVNANAAERGLALMEGELFRVLEPGSPRSDDMAIMMARMYREGVQVSKSKTGQTVILVSLTQTAGVSPEGEVSPAMQFQLGFGALLLLAHQQGFSLKTLHRARQVFIENVLTVSAYENMRKSPLFRLHRALIDAGHFDAYDYWLLGPAFPDEANAWTRGHEAQMEAFAKFMAKYPLFAKESRKGKSV
jgi:Tfp pilus assembly protein PilF